jgi:hypothetical protein
MIKIGFVLYFTVTQRRYYCRCVSLDFRSETSSDGWRPLQTTGLVYDNQRGVILGVRLPFCLVFVWIINIEYLANLDFVFSHENNVTTSTILVET